MKRALQVRLVLASGLFVLMAGMAAEACSGCAAKKAAESSCSSGGCGAESTELKPSACSACPAHKAAHPVNLSTEQMKSEVQKGEAVILDARGGKYFTGELIPGASQLTAKTDAAEIEKKLPNKGAEIITYCSHTKCPASVMLAEKLIGLGYTNVREYPEGIAGWKAAGGKVEQAK